MVYPILAEIIGSVSDDTEFSVDHARHDKIEITWDGVRLIGGNDLDGHALLAGLAGRGDFAPRDGLAEVEGPPFNVVQTTLGRRSSLQFASTTRERYRTPAGLSLLGGSLTLWPLSRSEFSATVFPIVAKLSLNPTRFVRHRLDNAGALDIRNGFPLQISRSSLLTRLLSKSSDKETIIDNNDNCIVERRNLRLLTPSVYRAYETAYLRQAFEFLSSRLQEISQQLPNSHLTGQPRFNLTGVETYWERACDNPHEYIRALADRVMTSGSPFRMAAYDRPTSFSRRGNSLFIARPLRKGLDLVVYAKTTARIRFEVRHDLQTDASHLNEVHTSTDLNQVISWIESTTAHAAREINVGRRNLLPAERQRFQLSDAVAFFGAFAAWEGDIQCKERVMGALISLGSYSGVGGPDASLIGHLTRRGVLVPGARGARSIHPRFSGVIHQLRHSPALGA